MITATQVKPRLKAEYNLGYVWLISIVAAMGGLLFGWDWVVIGGAKPFFQRYFQLTSEAQIGWANSCALIGCLVGALVAGALSDKFRPQATADRRGVAFCRDLARQCAGRQLHRSSSPGESSAAWPSAWRRIFRRCTSPKSRPAQIRGKLVAINQLTVVIGILLAQYINWFLVRNLPAGRHR